MSFHMIGSTAILFYSSKITNALCYNITLDDAITVMGICWLLSGLAKDIHICGPPWLKHWNTAYTIPTHMATRCIGMAIWLQEVTSDSLLQWSCEPAFSYGSPGSPGKQRVKPLGFQVHFISALTFPRSVSGNYICQLFLVAEGNWALESSSEYWTVEHWAMAPEGRGKRSTQESSSNSLGPIFNNRFTRSCVFHVFLFKDALVNIFLIYNQ